MKSLTSPIMLSSLAFANYDMPFINTKSNCPIFIPRKHPKMKYADHKRMKLKRKNKNR